jgi:hypothetical protein
MNLEQIKRLRPSIAAHVASAQRAVNGAAELGLGTNYAEVGLEDWRTLLRHLDDRAAELESRDGKPSDGGV